MAAKANIVLDQGADFQTTITVRGDDGAVTDLTGYTASGSIKKHYTSLTSIDFTMSFETPRSAGQLTLSLTRAQTEAMEPGRYVYDVEITDSSNFRSRLVEGIVTVTPQVTTS
jgi:hypothetical protein